MSELRYNPISGAWVVIATELSHKLADFITEKDPVSWPAKVDDCPFCPGNETASETIAQWDRNGSWGVRIVGNKFPVLSPSVTKQSGGSAMRRSVTGFGHHEVVIEHPEHNRLLWRQPTSDIAEVLEVTRKRYAELGEDSRIELVVPYKNHKGPSGTSVVHPHSQLVAMPIMPSDVRRRIENAARHFDETSRCLFCSVIDDELTLGERVVHQTAGFVSFIPYAALSPFHIMLFPTEHNPDFGLQSETGIWELADHLQGVLSKIELVLRGPDLNFVIRSVHSDRTDVRSFHWYLSLIPHVSLPAGFEMGSGMFVNPSDPDEIAKFVREVSVATAQRAV